VADVTARNPRTSDRVVLSTLLRKARSFRRHSGFAKRWLLPTWLLLGISRTLVLAVSFKRLAKRLGVSDAPAPWIPLLEPAQETVAQEIGRVVRLAARYTPWESNCFAQAVTARLLLGRFRIPYVLFFGLARDHSTGTMKAHAWVAAGRVRVTGGAGFGQFTVVGCFAAPELANTKTVQP